MSSIMDWQATPLMPQGVEHYTARYALPEHQQNLRLPLGVLPYPTIVSCARVDKILMYTARYIAILKS